MHACPLIQEYCRI
uniref:Uncharacterized protein n=1 Tax=Lepeophtheirus salmonis TaxID=72036 RepID=A0A0K2TGM4_LEPSM